jgi:hypothetical protein
VVLRLLCLASLVGLAVILSSGCCKEAIGESTAAAEEEDDSAPISDVKHDSRDRADCEARRDWSPRAGYVPLVSSCIAPDHVRLTLNPGGPTMARIGYPHEPLRIT